MGIINYYLNFFINNNIILSLNIISFFIWLSFIIFINIIVIFKVKNYFYLLWNILSVCYLPLLLFIGFLHSIFMIAIINIYILFCFKKYRMKIIRGLKRN
jgi:hypothetical protein